MRPLLIGMIAVILAVAVAREPARAQVGGPLFGGGPPPDRPPARLDPLIPTGRLVSSPEPRPTGLVAICSFRRPVCVHAGPDVEPQTASRWLGAMEEMWERIVWSLGAPVPLSDFDKGGTPALDLYLEAGGAPARTYTEAPRAWRGDAASVFCRAGVERSPRRSAALCIGHGVASRLGVSEPDGARSALSEHLWLSVGEPTAEDVALIDDAQAHPERTILSADSQASGGQVLLYEHLDRLGNGSPSGVALSMHALATGAPPLRGPRYVNEPDVYDVFRTTFGTKPTELGRAVTDFAVFRALLGRRAASGRPFGIDPTSPLARVRFDWRVSLSSLPRHLATREPVGPFGSTYVWIDVDEPADDVTLAVRATWEGPVSFAWSLVTLDREGRLLQRLDVPYQQRATRAEKTLVDLGAARAVVVVGINLGAVSPSFPFDPDYGPHEPHAASVYLAKLAP